MQSLAIPQHPVETTEKTFEQLGLSQAILRCIRLVGFEHPTPIQAAIIPAALTGKDLVGLAETGSGKTAAFTIPIAERLASSTTSSMKTRGLILSPTREIALQTQTFLDLFGGDYGLRTACLIGGGMMGAPHTAFTHKAHIPVATPRRLLDHNEQGTDRLGAL